MWRTYFPKDFLFLFCNIKHPEKVSKTNVYEVEETNSNHKDNKTQILPKVMSPNYLKGDIFLLFE